MYTIFVYNGAFQRDPSIVWDVGNWNGHVFGPGSSGNDMIRSLAPNPASSGR